MHDSLRRTLIAATALIGFSSFAVQAAPAPEAAPAPKAETKAEINAHHRMAGRVDEHIADLHKKLKITAEQQKPWDDFTQVMRANATRMDETFQRRVGTMSGMTAEQSMASYARMAQQHAQDMQAMVPVFSALYATMSDAQKLTADRVFRAEAHHGEMAKHG